MTNRSLCLLFAVAFSATQVSCTFAEDCPTNIQLEGKAFGRALNTMELKGSSRWDHPNFLPLGDLPLSFLFRSNYKSLIEKSGTSQEDEKLIRRLWDPDYVIYIDGEDSFGEVNFYIQFFFLGRSKVKMGDPVVVHDWAAVESITRNDLDSFVAFRDKVLRWMREEKPFALVYVDAYNRGPGPATERQYAVGGQVVINEFWSHAWKKLENFEDFVGRDFGRVYRVSANAQLHFLSDTAAPSLVSADAQCINARKFLESDEKSTQ